MYLNLKEIVDLIEFSLNKLYDRDSYLIKNDLHEQTITHKLANYMEQYCNELKYSLDVDVEYNRNIKDSKRWIFMNEKKLFKPDIIIHKRGENIHNTLIIEAKKKNCNDCNKIQLDHEKLKNLTTKEDSLYYRFGLFIEFADTVEKTKNKMFIYYRGEKYNYNELAQ